MYLIDRQSPNLQSIDSLSIDCCQVSALLDGDQRLLDELNSGLEDLSAQERIIWALRNLPGEQALSSSFGIQSALMLHMITRIKADIPVILIDTGYLFAETYQFIDLLSDRLKLNLHCFQPQISVAWQEARQGKLWLQGKDGIDSYNQNHKVEPMQRALKTLDVTSWFAGLRREQSSTRKSLPVLSIQQGRFKIHPVIDWHKRDVHRYLTKHSLPYHPLWEAGYVSVGDHHTSMPLQTGMSEEQTRFFGIQRECGLHV